jgi:hypothetical protein
MTWPVFRVPLRGRMIEIEFVSPQASAGPAWWFVDELQPAASAAEIAAVDWRVEQELERRRQAWREQKAEFLRRRMRGAALNQARQG